MLSTLALSLALLQSPIIAPGATLEKLGGGFSFTEGPTADRQGNVFFTDQPNDRIMKWNADGGVVEWLKPAGRSNGMAFDRRGNLITCADGQNQLWSINPKGKATVVLKDFKGSLLNGPNDLWIRPDQGLYFTDPLYVRPYWKRPSQMQQPGRYVYFLSKDRKAYFPVATDLKQPNGIAGTPDGKTLYVSDIDGGVTYRYQIQPDGTLTDKQTFCPLGSDGMTVDERGNVYLTGQGVTVFDPEGHKIEHIDVPEGWTANVTFGGRDRKLLFITASTGIYGLRMQVRGTE